MQKPFLALLVAASVALSAGLNYAEDLTIEKVKFGEYWYGPELSLEDAKGRVFLLEMWGRN